ncbi:MAG: nicotinate-nucleotide adenylyltransferase [Firmicutes bacterium]|jgi:nicotinate-nucleotide adenylyltransferase|nr:nicotinate-nucleotide adenylyltransferase [Bacillota bacterium]MBU4532736.1 nicotinate-nucleotide adenylyltransferase [Bacillota bacterium]MBU4553583.1 nicotinate-nucleotide adenylyltransferase [Bacillota bacterium]MDP3045155.1 nicotinate-nucleotide adenylyltransferase [Bacillota bacterium]
MHLRKLAVMGGTFDPVHYGHLVAAEGVRHEFQLEKVVFIPAGRPPHKTDQRISEAKHRLAMTTLAVASNPCIEVSDLEINRPGPSYTFDTVQEVYRRYRPEEVFFITGADAVLEILSWHRVQDLLNKCCVIAATRPGHDLNSLKGRLEMLPAHLTARIVPLEVPALAISSSDIRRRVQNGKPIKYLLPEVVEEYINIHGLYQQDLH